MKPQPELELDIVDLAHDGRGVARVDGKAVFVTGALRGERVRARITRQHRQYDEAKVLTVLTAAPERVVPRCEYFGVCGGCTLQHMDAAAQIVAKQHVLEENFARIGKVRPARWLPPLTGEPWNYRRRGRLSVRHVPQKGRTLVGFREAGNPRYVADIRHCDVVDPRLDPAIGAIGDLVSGLDAAASIAQIEFAAADDTVALVFRHLQPLSRHDLDALKAFAVAHEFAVYLQPGGEDSVRPLWPEHPRLCFHLPDDNITFDFEPLDFVQVNARINQQMVARVLELLAPAPESRVLDLFCGLGNFTLPIAHHAAEVAGVEGSAALVARAAANADRNGITNARFHLADLFQDQRDLAWARRDWDAILLDPPRAGAQEVLAYLPRKTTRRVVYVSCHPASLARDAGLLVDRHGFRLAAAGVMDMFPHTAHVESVALFERD